MFYKLTALVLSCFMLVVATAGQVGLQYCLCEKTVFFGHCPCATAQPVSSESKSRDHCSCCDSCGEESQSSLVEIHVVPCDDCVVSFQLKLDECVPQLGVDLKVSNDPDVLGSRFTEASQITVDTLIHTEWHQVRGSPPPPAPLSKCSTLPLYKEFSVYQI